MRNAKPISRIYVGPGPSHTVSKISVGDLLVQQGYSGVPVEPLPEPVGFLGKMSVPWNFIALLGGIIAVAALYFSATHADKEIAAAQARAAQLEKEAAEARLKPPEIENLTAWRRLRADQRDQLTQAIRDH